MVIRDLLDAVGKADALADAAGRVRSAAGRARKDAPVLS